MAPIFLVYYENPVLIKHQRTLCKGCFFRLDDFSREGEESTEKSLAFLYYLLPFFLIVLILLIFILYQKSIYDHQKTTVSQETLISVTKDKYSLCPTDPPVSV